MKANSLEELVTNSNIAGELRNYTDWHTRLVKFAQLVADWQKEQDTREMIMSEGSYFQKCYELGRKDLKERMLMLDAVEASVNTYELIPGGFAYVEFVANTPVAHFKSNDKVRIVVLKEEEE